jgi:acyl-coenzyme A thioesterase PaaI-like protein
MRVRSDGTLPAHHPNCLGCGQENAAGLHMRMRKDGDHVRTALVFDRRHEGAPGFAHGGAVATAIDDLFGGLLLVIEKPAVTASLTVDYRSPALLGRTLELDGWCESVDGRKLDLRGTIHDGSTLVAEGRALFLAVDVEHFASAGRPLPDGWKAWGGDAT